MNGHPNGAAIAPAWRNRITAYGMVAPADLLANPFNFRRHPPGQRAAMAGILERVGWLQDVIVNHTTGHILDGHLRVDLALRHGEALIPVKYVELSEDEERIALSTFDPISNMAEIDPAALRGLLGRVEMAPIAGDDLAPLWAALQAAAGADDEATEAAQDAEPQTERAAALRAEWGVEPGQVWALGDHRLLCGDCLDPAAAERVMAGETPALVIADPPYGLSIVEFDGFVGGGERGHYPFGGVKQSIFGKATKAPRAPRAAARPPAGPKYATIAGDDTTTTARSAAALYLGLYPGAVQVWWGANHYSDALPASPCWMVWDKETNGTFARCELAWTNQGKPAKLFHHRWNGMLRDSERGRRWHPSQKPAALAAWVFTELCAVGATVLDPFAGAGWAILGAHNSGHRCRAIEQSADYCAVILERYQEASGQAPELMEAAP